MDGGHLKLVSLPQHPTSSCSHHSALINIYTILFTSYTEEIFMMKANIKIPGTTPKSNTTSHINNDFKNDHCYFEHVSGTVSPGAENLFMNQRWGS